MCRFLTVWRVPQTLHCLRVNCVTSKTTQSHPFVFSNLTLNSPAYHWATVGKTAKGFSTISLFPVFIFLYFYFLLMVASAAYGSSCARDRIRASAEVYTTAMAIPNLSTSVSLCCSFQQCRILNPLSEARK